MKKYIQRVYLNHQFKSRIERDADEIIELLVRMHILRQEGCKYYVGREYNEDGDLMIFTVDFDTADGDEIYHEFEIQDVEGE